MGSVTFLHLNLPLTCALAIDVAQRRRVTASASPELSPVSPVVEGDLCGCTVADTLPASHLSP